MPKNFSSRDYLFYVSAATPSTNAAWATDYTKVGLGQSLSISRSRNAMDKSNKDSVDESDFVSGRRNQVVNASGVFDHTEDGGYTILSSVYESSAGVVWFLITSINTGDTEWYGSGTLTDFSVTLDDESISTFSVSIQVSGALTEAAGDAT